jgi:hypothetical protein
MADNSDGAAHRDGRGGLLVVALHSLSTVVAHPVRLQPTVMPQQSLFLWEQQFLWERALQHGRQPLLPMRVKRYGNRFCPCVSKGTAAG